jgi:hypothetical protein
VIEEGAIRIPGPQHEWANYYEAAVILLYHSFSVALLAVLTSTVALWAGQGTIASAAVVVIWLGLIAGGIV